MAGPLGFFRGLCPRVLYSMPATAICWSTYEFFKYILSSKSREEYKSSVSGKSALQPKDVIVGTDKSRMDETTFSNGIRYVLPTTTFNNAADSTDITMTSVKPRDSSSMSAATSVYPTISLTTIHTDTGRKFDRSCNT